MAVRELTSFACSPNEVPLDNSSKEIDEVRDACQWGDKVKNVYGGTVTDIRKTLHDRPTKRFLFAGHCDASDASTAYGKTLGCTEPGGTLESLTTPNKVADLFIEFSVLKGGLLDLVALNGCDSYALGRKLHKGGISIVVCWGTKTLDAGGRLFAKTFFKQIASSKTPKEAFIEGVRALASMYRIEGQHPLPPKNYSGQTNNATTSYPLPPKNEKLRAGVPVLLTQSGSWTANAAGVVVELTNLDSHVFQTGPDPLPSTSAAPATA